jgi:hypothetical protein
VPVGAREHERSAPQGVGPTNKIRAIPISAKRKDGGGQVALLARQREGPLGGCFVFVHHFDKDALPVEMPVSLPDIAYDYSCLGLETHAFV